MSISESEQTVNKNSISITDKKLIKKNEELTKTNEEGEDDNAQRIVYIVLIVVFVIMFTVSLIALEYRNNLLKELEKYKKVIKENLFPSIGILLVCHVLGSLLMVPGTLFLMPGGFVMGYYFNGELYGYFIAILIILHINIFSGFIAFLNSKMCLKSYVRKNLINKSKKLKSIDNILKKHGVKAIFCLRLSPILPIYLFNYILGGFEISNATFLISAYGGIPGVMVDIYLGYSASQLGEIMQLKENQYVSLLIVLFGLIILIGMIVWLNKYSQESFQQLIDEQNDSQLKDRSEKELSVITVPAESK